MAIHTNQKFTAEQIELCAPDKHVCGCGTCKDVIDTATRMVATGLREDCATWNILVYEMAIMIIANAQFAKIMSTIPPELKYSVDQGARAVEDWRGALNMQTACMVAANEKYVSEQVEGPVRAAMLKEPLKNEHKAPESKQ